MHIHECIEIKERNLLRGEEGIFHLDLLKTSESEQGNEFWEPRYHHCRGKVDGGGGGKLGIRSGGQKGINSSHQIAIIILIVGPHLTLNGKP